MFQCCGIGPGKVNEYYRVHEGDHVSCGLERRYYYGESSFFAFSVHDREKMEKN